MEVARAALSENRVARRANAVLLLDDGLSCMEVAKVLYLDDDTVRRWYDVYVAEKMEGLSRFGFKGSACDLTLDQQEQLKAWVRAALPRSTREVGAWIAQQFGIIYKTRSALIKLLHRLGMDYRKPKAVSAKLDPSRQEAFIKAYNALLNSLCADEVVLCGDGVHPAHSARPVGCWAPKDVPLAVDQTSGRDHLNIHGAIDLETGKTSMIEAETLNRLSTLALLEQLEALYPIKRKIHLFLDNAPYHHAKLVREWLAQPGRRIVLHFIPSYCPHLNPIERLWGVMHRYVTHNKCYSTFDEFRTAILNFLTKEVPKKWDTLCDSVTDNFRIIDPKNFRIVK